MQGEEDRDARALSPATSQNIETSDIEEDDISVGDNCSETSTKNNLYDTSENLKKTDADEKERSSPLEYNLNNRISNSNFNSPFKEDENEYEHKTDDRMKFYEGGIFQLYRSERDRDGHGHKDEGNEGTNFRHMGGPLSESLYGRSMDLTKGSFQSQLLAGFAASVMAGNSQRDSQENTGAYTLFYLFDYFQNNSESCCQDSCGYCRFAAHFSSTQFDRRNHSKQKTYIS